MSLLPLLALLTACENHVKRLDTGAYDTGVPTNPDSDADSDSDTDADTDADTEPEAHITSWDAHFASDVTTITTRQTARVVVTATWSDGSTTDGTAAATISSSNTSIVSFYEHDVAQPLLAGSVQVSVRTSDGTSLPALPLTVTMSTPQAGDLVFNEMLIDPATTTDANRDGTADSVEDEFLEIANAADVTLDLGGVTIWDQGLSNARHTFPSPTILQAGQVIVVFGGGSASRMSASNATFVVADNTDYGLTHGLALNNSGDVPQLRASNGTVLASTPYGDAGGPSIVNDSSLVLSPEVTGTHYTGHTSVSSAAQSPGTYADGSPFPGPAGTY